MPFVILAFGVVLVVAGVRGTQGALFTLLKNDLTGFAPWFVAILFIGALGYIKPIKPITDAFMVLLIVVLFLSNGGFFAKLFGTSTTSASNPLSSNQTSLPTMPSLTTLGGSFANYSSLTQ
jgi:hypothetical protein